MLNKSNYGIFYMEDFFDKYFIEQNKKRESLIFEISNDSIYYNHIGEDESFLEIGSNFSAMFDADFLNTIPIITGTVTIKNILIAILVNEIF